MLPVSCLLLTYFSFRSDIVRFGVSCGDSVFQTGSCLLWRWYVMLFWATRALVNISFPICHGGHRSELCTEDLEQKISRNLQSAFCWLAFLPPVLQFLFCKSCLCWLFFPFSKWSEKLFFPQEKSSFASFFPTGTDGFENKLVGKNCTS